MSSHHFVKEGQEPALLILDAPSFEVAGPLLEWAPMVIVAQQAIDDVLLWNIKVDVVLAKDADVKDLGSKLASQAPLTILGHSPEESPLINALYFLIRKKQSAVNIFSSQAIETIELVESFAPELQISVMDGALKWSAISSGHFEKWMTANSRFFLKEGRQQQPVVFRGLKNLGDHYESLNDGMVKLESASLFWVGEPDSGDPGQASK